MTRLLLALLLLLGLTINFGCTSGDKGEESDVAVAEEDSAAEGDLADDEVGGEDEKGAEDEGDYAEEGDDDDDSEEYADEEGDDDDDDWGEEGDGQKTADTEEGSVQADMGDDAPAEATDEGGSEELFTDAGEQTYEEPPAEEASPFADEAGTASYDDSAPTWIPVKKVASAPFDKNGSLVNGIYIAREGDSIESISEKIYGSSDRSEDLLSINTTLRRGVDPGDKIYYNSPKRPADRSQLLTYYEDMGIPSQSYVTQPGDNIRTVSKSLLGFNGAWKEVWATNPDVESKGEVAEGIELRYWADGGSGSMADMAPTDDGMDDMAMNDSMPVPPPPPPSSGGMPEPPPMPEPPDMAMNDSMPGAAGSIEPPPPPTKLEPPPPPPPPKPVMAKKPKPKKRAKAGMNKDMKFYLAAGGAILVGLAVILGIVRKNRSRRMSQQTQV
jgi:hypothetical protein